MANKHAKAKNPRKRAIVSLVATLVVAARLRLSGALWFRQGNDDQLPQALGRRNQPWVLTCAAVFTPFIRLTTRMIPILTRR